MAAAGQARRAEPTMAPRMAEWANMLAAILEQSQQLERRVIHLQVADLG